MGQNSALYPRVVRRSLEPGPGRNSGCDACPGCDWTRPSPAWSRPSRAGALRTISAHFPRGFSEIQVEIDDTIEQDDKVMARWTRTLTHSGTFLGIPSSGKCVSVNGMSVQRIVGGKIVEAGTTGTSEVAGAAGAVLPAKSGRDLFSSTSLFRLELLMLLSGIFLPSRRASMLTARVFQEAGTQCRALPRTPVAGVVVLGSTGEAVMLSDRSGVTSRIRAGCGCAQQSSDCGGGNRVGD